MAPFADLLFFADGRWWTWHREKPEFKAFAGEKCTIQGTGVMCDDPAVHMLRNHGREGISTDPAGLATGGNSSYMATNLLVHAGCSPIGLIGVDAKPGPSGKKHCFGDHPDRSYPPFRDMVLSFRTMVAPLKALGVDLINCTPGSAVDAFPRMDLESFLAHPA